jgi:hypothetical protein
MDKYKKTAHRSLLTCIRRIHAIKISKKLMLKMATNIPNMAQRSPGWKNTIKSAASKIARRMRIYFVGEVE